jgi:hydroxymethylbilane synthase
VRGALARHGVAAELVIIRTAGDRDRQSSLRVIGGKGVFTKELEDALLDERIDLAVHSMKDVPTTLPAGLEIAAICEREDVRDALIARGGLTLNQLPSGARIGTSSLRRQAQLRHYRNDFQMRDMRGNVDTRLAKLTQGDYDAIILAKAGLDRLGKTEQISEIVPPGICLPAAGQGAIGIETRKGDEAVVPAVRKLSHQPSQVAVEAERAVLEGLESGCQVPIGVWARVESGKLRIDARVLAVDGAESIRESRTGECEKATELGSAVAAALLDRGANRLLRLAERGVEHVRFRSLEGRRIVVTRPLEQSNELRARLQELGAEVISLPLVRFLEPEDTADLDRAIRSLEKFDWLIFTSANAVGFFLGRCRALGCWPAARPTKIAAVGSATRLAIEKQGLKVSFVPREFSGAGLAAEMSALIAGKSALLPRSDRASEELPSLLGKAGANVTEVVAYRTVGPEISDDAVTEAMRDGRADAIAFFSPSAFREFQKLMGSDGLSKCDSRIAFAAVGPVTAESIRSAGLPVAIEADEATTGSLVAALQRHFSALETKAGS